MPARSVTFPDPLQCEDIGLIATGAKDCIIRREKSGDDWKYLGPSGQVVDSKTRERCKALAIAPAWEEVGYSIQAQGHLQAVATDQSGKRQYIYHPTWRDAAEHHKFLRIQPFGYTLSGLRRRVSRILKTERLNTDFKMATLTRLIDRAALRIGDRADAARVSRGASTLSVDNVVEQAGHPAELQFVAKGGRERTVPLTDRRLITALEILLSDADDYAFEDASGEPFSPERFNAWLQRISGQPITAKDFRTWHGSVAALRAWLCSDTPTVKEAAETAAHKLGNTAAIARTAYIHPAVVDAIRRDISPPNASGPTRLRKYERLLLGLIEEF